MENAFFLRRKRCFDNNEHFFRHSYASFLPPQLAMSKSNGGRKVSPQRRKEDRTRSVSSYFDDLVSRSIRFFDSNSSIASESRLCYPISAMTMSCSGTTRSGATSKCLPSGGWGRTCSCIAEMMFRRCICHLSLGAQQSLYFRNEPHGERIHAVTGVFLRQPFPEEDVPEVRRAIHALDFRPRSVGIGDAFHGVRESIVEGWPTAARVEFVRRSVEFDSAATTDVASRFLEIIICARERRFGAFVLDHMFFSRCQRIRFHAAIVLLRAAFDNCFVVHS